MIGFIRTRKRVFSRLLLVVLDAAAVFGGTGAMAPKPELPEIVKVQRRAVGAAKDRRAAEAYEKRDTEVAHWVENGAPPNPDNAALLYYQAFLLRPEPNTAIIEKIHDVFFDAEPDRQLRTYLGHCLPMMEMAEIASRIPKCTWGIWHGSEPRFSAKDLNSQVSNLRDILLVDARTLGADGRYRAALERCLTVRRMARHLSNSSNVGVVLMARSGDAMALRTVRHVLSLMPSDAEILTWFRGQLAVVQGVPPAFSETLQADFKRYLDHVRTNPVPLRYLRNRLIKQAEDERAKDAARNLTDEELLSRACAPFPDFFDSIFRIADSEMEYEQKLTQMQRLYNEFKEEHGTDPVVAYVLQWAGPGYMIDRQYPFQVGHEAHINGIKAAVEIYLVLAKTGELPEKLPEHLPKDPFTGRDFGYEITDEGFALRCQGEEFLTRKKS
jgi:hypothetical protein